MAYYENKNFNLLIEKISVFEIKNKAIKEANKNYQVDLKSLRTSLQNAQKKLKFLKENYKILKAQNKSTLRKLKNSKVLTNKTEIDQSEELLTNGINSKIQNNNLFLHMCRPWDFMLQRSTQRVFKAVISAPTPPADSFCKYTLSKDGLLIYCNS